MALIGWVSLVEADAYFLTRTNSAMWSESYTDKTAALTTAYNQLKDSGRFNLPASPDAAGKLKRAQCEQAFFILKNQEDADERMALQAQHVTQAGIVQETYQGDGIPISSYAISILSAWDRYRQGLFVAEATRTEDETEDI